MFAHQSISFLPSDRSYMRLTEKENETLPIDVSGFNPLGLFLFARKKPLMNCLYLSWSLLLFQIVLQTLLSFVMTCYGIVHIAGEFKDMDASSELKNK